MLERLHLFLVGCLSKGVKASDRVAQYRVTQKSKPLPNYQKLC